MLAVPHPDLLDHRHREILRVRSVRVNAELTWVLVAELTGTSILVNVYLTRRMNTRMAYGETERTPEKRADTPVWLATQPPDAPTGGLFRQPCADRLLGFSAAERQCRNPEEIMALSPGRSRSRKLLSGKPSPEDTPAGIVPSSARRPRS